MWKCNSEENWKCLLSPFKKGRDKGSMILVTARFPSIAQMVKTTKPIELQGLEHNELFAFFEECILGENKPVNYKDDLIGIARDIFKKLKGSPLAARTVGRLLKKNLSQEFWMEVLERNEWKNQKGDDDIMPALQISYDYLPFDLKKFNNLEITRFWEALGIVEAEDIGLRYLDELVGNGFLVMEDEGCIGNTISKPTRGGEW
uniref:Uncharacterized protein n=1 Tax=Leersia perrieri TaxID=77586 RepID=A0A0D9VEH6_9ORYZ